MMRAALSCHHEYDFTAGIPHFQAVKSCFGKLWTKRKEAGDGKVLAFSDGC